VAGAAAAPAEESLPDRGVILTPDQRVRVFISSTLGELAEERAAARRAVRRLHLVPVWYESGARPHPPRSMYRSYLAQSQVFVGIYWQRYGWVAPGMNISGLEDEFRLAAGKPMLLYLKRPAPDQEPRLAAMIDGIRAAGTVSYRTLATARELERLLADDLAVLLSESFAGATARAGVTSGPGEPDAELPSGTVTFLLTDIEGSTRLWESVPAAMEVALDPAQPAAHRRNRGAWRGGGDLPGGGRQFLRRVSRRGGRSPGGRGVPAGPGAGGVARGGGSAGADGAAYRGGPVARQRPC
jgi:uncharacterized protein DUF4062